MRTVESPSPAIDYEHNRPERLQQEIRRRAYQIWEERDRSDGEALHDWLRAEREIMSHEIMGNRSSSLIPDLQPEGKLR
jgi:hypothetical protein